MVTNAAKYSPANSQIDVSLSLLTDGTPELSVKDQGSGISETDKVHIFERFYRSADVRGTVVGTGLGLAIATQLAKLSNSQLTVQDNEPQGTIFTLTLPHE
nr:sensor histidine kinase [Lacticaseibacillus thailandensis]